MGKSVKYLSFLIIFTVHCSLLIVHCNAQDRPASKPPLLPFQTPAPTQTSDEQLAIQFFQNRDYEKAAEVYERLYNKQPVAYYQYYYYCLIEIHDYDKAEKLVKTARKSDPDAPKYMVDLGYIYYRQGNHDKAQKMYDNALKNLTANQQQINELANAFSSHLEMDYTVKTYLRGRELLKGSYPYSLELAMTYERMGRYAEMIGEYLNLLDYKQTFLPTVEDRLQSALANDPDDSKNEIFRKTILLRAQKEPDKSYYSELLWWYSVQQRDFGLALVQAKSLDRRLNEDGSRVFQLAKLCFSNGDYDAAIDAYKYLIAKGTACPYYIAGKAELLNTRYFKTVSAPDPPEKELLSLEKEFESEIHALGINKQSVSMVRNLAHLDAFYLGKTDQAAEQLNHVIDLNDIPALDKAECKLDLADILVFTNDVWDATLLYQQVNLDFRNDAIGQEAKFRNAKLSYYIGEFKWAQAQLDVLKAATSKLIANDAMALSLLINENFDADSGTVALGLYARADLLDFRNMEAMALRTLDSIPLLFKEHTIMNQVLFKKAQINMKEGNFPEADTLLGTLIKDFPDNILSDDALITRGRLNEEQIRNNDKAMACYQELMTQYPGSIFTVEARKRFRTLRGDKIQ
jgi:tetratricopeptide (TPR) repeat protein